jgi:hypothetical protein
LTWNVPFVLLIVGRRTKNDGEVHNCWGLG